MDGRRKQSSLPHTPTLEYQELQRRMAEVRALREQVAALEQVGKKRTVPTTGKRPSFHSVLGDRVAMSRIKQDDTIIRAATLSKPQSSAPANDNDGDGAWSLLPFPDSVALMEFGATLNGACKSGREY